MNNGYKLDKGKSVAKPIELGELIAYMTNGIAQSTDRETRLAFDAEGERICGFEVVNRPTVTIQLGQKKLQANLLLMTTDGKLCVVHIPELLRSVPVLFRDLETSNPGLMLPAKIDRRNFAQDCVIYGSVGGFIGVFAGAIKTIAQIQGRVQRGESFLPGVLRDTGAGAAIGSAVSIGVTCTRRAFLKGMFGRKQ